MPISGIFCRRVCTIMSASSRVSPELESISTASAAPIMPRSPWLASAGWTNWAGVPVEAKVAAILVAMWPLLPMPLTITRPLTPSSVSTAAAKAPSSAAPSAPSAAASMARTRRATARSVALSAGAVMARGDSNGNRPLR